VVSQHPKNYPEYEFRMFYYIFNVLKDKYLNRNRSTRKYSFLWPVPVLYPSAGVTHLCGGIGRIFHQCHNWHMFPGRVIVSSKRFTFSKRLCVLRVHVLYCTLYRPFSTLQSVDERHQLLSGSHHHTAAGRTDAETNLWQVFTTYTLSWFLIVQIKTGSYVGTVYRGILSG
jgi:hypothetical protein